ncbi:MAG: methyltransferase, partial [Chloroflexi bacterium]|nr:methyltransferase [Chloroflexota bacterium]
FATSQNLFSSNTIDPGTNLLLRMVAAHAGRTFQRALDVGCGYGVIGSSLVASGIANSADMVDRDALAVAFARKNINLNGQANVRAFASLGYDDVPVGPGYDLVVSNLPGKAGESVLRHLLSGARDHMMPDGQVWVVGVTPLRDFIETTLCDSGASIIQVEHGPRHSVYGFHPGAESQLPPESDPSDSIASGVYVRGSVDFEVGNRSYALKTNRGVPEFEEISYPTRLLLEQLYVVRKRRFSAVAVFNVTHGYVPLSILAARMASQADMSDRDLLALRSAEHNLAASGFDCPATALHHDFAWLPQGDSQFDLVAGTLRGDEPDTALESGIAEIAMRLVPDGVAMIAGGSTPITRMLKVLDGIRWIIVTDRKRYRGSSVAVFTRAASAN